MSGVAGMNIGQQAGLCGSCTYQRVIENRRGSRFVFCERSKTDGTYRKYPPLPVLECEGFEAAPTTKGSEAR